MDIRYKAYYFHEAEAIHRQEMARIAHSVAAGFSDKSGFNSFIASLELQHSRSDAEKDEKEGLKLADKVVNLLRGLGRR